MDDKDDDRAGRMGEGIDVKVRLLHGGEIAMGPGKADLLDAIGRTGSISAAARAMGMSYRRAWLLVDVMNRGFGAPLVRSAAGGSRGGGAKVTATGMQVLTHYRAMQAAASAAAGPYAAALSKLLRPGD
ncbi:winged helix-turn-helix domain-containing protein [Massilia antarctica]|uniref:winged helix-turn-helix domain-containing protein n=1 Tax=Massilia antarctica TaxID=2765360 RepID=UPI0006BD0C78|nr:LysR family transcriptional regulator [Massilia sp. H27-R4]MCY0912591.1 LysR family transcriptional regulator [Massilia sp. H27-R4]CUI03648.1 DNA-binding domain of ModE [Janthinobacterium sp. CG23_2]CUU27434.1 DNA-binding domain of ModE [Janthinobacterium sp. CG23_2]